MKPRNWELLEDAAAELKQIGLASIDFPVVDGLAPEDQPHAFIEKLISRIHDNILFLRIAVDEQRKTNVA